MPSTKFQLSNVAQPIQVPVSQSVRVATRRSNWSLAAPILLAMLSIIMSAADNTQAVGFAGFDRRARAGEHLNVVFFGASLTWGANATNQSETSYRAVVRDRLEQRYPTGIFRCWDAAIGGTGSQLGAFRLDRDVFAHHPDLVFLDFSANDDIGSADPETLASYESILRRLVQAGIPVVQVAFPFRWNIETAKLPELKRLTAHRALAQAYGSGWGDAVTAVCQGVDAGKLNLDKLWNTDPVHPGDAGYREFAGVAWSAYLAALQAGLTPIAPQNMLYADTYMTLRRVALANLPKLPAGWSKGRPNLTSLYYDFQMSRWMDEQVVGRNRAVDANKNPLPAAQPVAALRLQVEASSVVLFGEATPGSGRFRVRIDGTILIGRPDQIKDTDLFDANRWPGGNGHLVIELARGLDASKPHLVEIEPVFEDNKDQELRIESICVAGGKATAVLVP